MFSPKPTLALLLLILTTLASTTPFDPSLPIPALTAQQIRSAAPGSASCNPPRFSTDECTDSEKVSEELNKAFKKFNIQTLGEKAALVGLMALESVDFQANINHYPGRPGQGTKAMLQFNFIYEYAYSFPQLRDKVLQITGGQQLSVNSNNIDSFPVQTQTSIRALVLPDVYSFSAAAWFLKQSSVCPRGTSTALSQSGFMGFSYYMVSCVGVETTLDRVAKWCAAVKALKPSEMQPPVQCS